MEAISLSNNFKLSFQKLPHTIKLIVSKKDEELVCRKEKLKNLFSFLEMDEEHIFKGRLQLFKLGDRIAIQINNEEVGSIHTQAFLEILSKLS